MLDFMHMVAQANGSWGLYWVLTLENCPSRPILKLKVARFAYPLEQVGVWFADHLVCLIAGTSIRQVGVLG
jgi:hypothetical protein